VNAADLATVITFLGCSLIAPIVAVSEKAGWFAILFIALGVAIGLGAGYCVRSLAYFLLASGSSQSEARPWLGWPLLLAYIIIPMIAATGAIAVTGGLAVWLARHIL
jgi:hypothetical protein